MVRLLKKIIKNTLDSALQWRVLVMVFLIGVSPSVLAGPPTPTPSYSPDLGPVQSDVPAPLPLPLPLPLPMTLSHSEEVLLESHEGPSAGPGMTNPIQVSATDQVEEFFQAISDKNMEKIWDLLLVNPELIGTKNGTGQLPYKFSRVHSGDSELTRMLAQLHYLKIANNTSFFMEVFSKNEEHFSDSNQTKIREIFSAAQEQDFDKVFDILGKSRAPFCLILLNTLNENNQSFRPILARHRGKIVTSKHRDIHHGLSSLEYFLNFMRDPNPKAQAFLDKIFPELKISSLKGRPNLLTRYNLSKQTLPPSLPLTVPPQEEFDLSFLDRDYEELPKEVVAEIIQASPKDLVGEFFKAVSDHDLGKIWDLLIIDPDLINKRNSLEQLPHEFAQTVWDKNEITDTLISVHSLNAGKLKVLRALQDLFKTDDVHFSVSTETKIREVLLAAKKKDFDQVSDILEKSPISVSLAILNSRSERGEKIFYLIRPPYNIGYTSKSREIFALLDNLDTFRRFVKPSAPKPRMVIKKIFPELNIDSLASLPIMKPRIFIVQPKEDSSGKVPTAPLTFESLFPEENVEMPDTQVVLGVKRAAPIANAFMDPGNRTLKEPRRETGVQDAPLELPLQTIRSELRDILSGGPGLTKEVQASEKDQVEKFFQAISDKNMEKVWDLLLVNPKLIETKNGSGQLPEDFSRVHSGDCELTRMLKRLYALKTQPLTRFIIDSLFNDQLFSTFYQAKMKQIFSAAQAQNFDQVFSILKQRRLPVFYVRLLNTRNDKNQSLLEILDPHSGKIVDSNHKSLYGTLWYLEHFLRLMRDPNPKAQAFFERLFSRSWVSTLRKPYLNTYYDLSGQKILPPVPNLNDSLNGRGDLAKVSSESPAKFSGSDTQHQEFLDRDPEEVPLELHDGLSVGPGLTKSAHAPAKDQVVNSPVLSSKDEGPDRKSIRPDLAKVPSEIPAESSVPDTQLVLGAKRPVPIANAFMDPTNRTLKEPRRETVVQQAPLELPLQSIRFSQVKSDSYFNKQIEKTLLASNRFSCLYYSLSKTLPKSSDRVSIILAGRGKNASVPEEKAGGKIVLLLSPEQERVANSLVGIYTDVCVIKDMWFWGKQLSGDAISYVTTRRIAAFELAQMMASRAPGGRPTIAVIDDNLTRIEIKKAFRKQGQANVPKTWPDFYQSMAQMMESDHLTVLGLKQKYTKYQSRSKTGQDPTAVSAPAAATQIIDQGEEGDRGGYGQKIFFFRFSEVVEAIHKTKNPESHIPYRRFSGQEIPFELLFPPHVFLPQEDLYFQLYLASAQNKVAHIDNKEVEFVRSDPTSLAKPIIDRNSIKTESWLGIDLNEEPNPHRVNATEQILTMLGYKLDQVAQSQKRYRTEDPSVLLKKARYPEEYKQRPAAAGPEPKRSGSDDDDKSHRIKKYREDQESNPSLAYQRNTFPLPKADGVRFSEIDPNEGTSWSLFGRALVRVNNPELWRHQKNALMTLGTTLLPGETDLDQSRTLYFDMATASGKTFIFQEITRAAHEHLKGNIILINPDLTLKEQNTEAFAKLFGVDSDDIIPISSKQADLSARLASINEPLMFGKRILIFCEKSFNLFVASRKGNLQDISLVLVDEMHKTKAETLEYLKKMKASMKGLVLGFSATPGAKEIREAFTRPIFSYSTEQGVSDKILAPWLTRAVGLDLSEKDLPFILPQVLQNEEFPTGGKLKDKQGVIYINGSTALADEIALALNAAQIPAIAYHTHMDKPGRKAGGVSLLPIQKKVALRQFRAGEVKVLVAIRTLREGFDAPMDYVFVTNKNPTDDDMIQMRGRVLRLPKNMRKIALLLTVKESLAQKFNYSKQNELFWDPAVTNAYRSQKDVTYPLQAIGSSRMVESIPVSLGADDSDNISSQSEEAR